MALVGGGPFAPASESGRRSTSLTQATMPAFERRALLRDKRHRVVADLRAARVAPMPRSTAG
jgi:hypothetical protein